PPSMEDPAELLRGCLESAWWRRPVLADGRHGWQGLAQFQQELPFLRCGHEPGNFWPCNAPESWPDLFAHLPASVVLVDDSVGPQNSLLALHGCQQLTSL
ncbi:hypothetical protein EGW08_020981, partial [Elysia chlorotica]